MKLFPRVVGSIATLTTATAVLVGCGMLSKKQDTVDERSVYEERHDTGCVQGVVMNGQTGERIALTGRADGEGIFVLARSSHLDAESADDAEFLKGEYVLCGVPLDESFPIFARFNGFGEFYSHVQVESTLAQKSPEAEVDIRKPAPTRIANIRMYPIGVETQDLKIKVVHNGDPVENATVRLTPQGRSFFDDNNFLAPMNYRSQPMVFKSDVKGEVIVAKSELMLGASYNYDVLPPNGGIFHAAQNGTLIIGLGRAGANQADPYSLLVNLADSRESNLALVSSSLDTANYDSRGRISLVYNRAVKIARGTEDKQTAFLSNAVKAKIRSTVAGNGSSEQVSVYAEGNTVVIEPIFENFPDSTSEPGLEITYSGIMIQVEGGPNETFTKDLGSLTVKLFDGTAQPIPFKYADSLELTSGNNQSGQVSTALSSALKVRVYDQFGEPFAGQKILFEPAAGNGGGTLSAYVATTDSLGYAQVNWTLGKSVGSQTVTINATSVHGTTLKGSPGIFTATATAAPAQPVATSMSVYSGNNQSGTVSSTLSSDIQIRVFDQNGNSFAGQAVTFEVSTGGGSVAVITGTTDSSGIATAKWTLGSSTGTQTLTVRATNANGNALGSVTFTATAN